MKSNKKQKSTHSFVWSDDEVELLLIAVHEYKVSEMINLIDRNYVNRYVDKAIKLGKELSPSKNESKL